MSKHFTYEIGGYAFFFTIWLLLMEYFETKGQSNEEATSRGETSAENWKRSFIESNFIVSISIKLELNYSILFFIVLFL